MLLRKVPLYWEMTATAFRLRSSEWDINQEVLCLLFEVFKKSDIKKERFKLNTNTKAVIKYF